MASFFTIPCLFNLGFRHGGLACFRGQVNKVCCWGFMGGQLVIWQSMKVSKFHGIMFFGMSRESVILYSQGFLLHCLFVWSGIWAIWPSCMPIILIEGMPLVGANSLSGSQWRSPHFVASLSSLYVLFWFLEWEKVFFICRFFRYWFSDFAVMKWNQPKIALAKYV